MVEYKRYVGESEEELIYRIASEKDVIGTWEDIANILNELLGYDYGESTYRKKYNAFVKMFEANRSKFEGFDARIQDLEDKRRAFEREKIKFQDERNAWQRQNRGVARIEQKLDYLEDLIKDESEYRTYPKRVKFVPDDRDVLICVSDVHLGLSTGNTLMDAYNPKIAEEFFNNYLDQIDEIIKTYNVRNAYVALLGDEVNGLIHQTVRLENSENVIQQIQSVSEHIARFIYEISKRVTRVFVNDVGGNHTRIGKKDDVLRDERLDSLILWYSKAKLAHVENVEFLDHCKYDPTIAYFNICGLQFLLCHGDYDTSDASGVQKLSMMIGEIPYAVVMGHRHSTGYSEVSGVKLIQSGTFATSGSDYCIQKRLVGSPSQAVAVVDDEGIRAFYPIQLK